MDPRDDELSTRFEARRAVLTSLAYRMLGDTGAAEDAVQQAWLRLSRPGATDLGTIDNLNAWMATSVSRVCLNVLRSRAARPETPSGSDELELVVGPEGQDPADQAQLADQVNFALDLVLRALTPPERLAFILHDSFGVPFNDIAPILDRSVEATRKLASRARARVQALDPRTIEHGQARQRRAVDAFYRASRAGDFDALVELLHLDVTFHADGGTSLPDATAIIRGSDAVARRAAAFARPDTTEQPITVNGGAGALIHAGTGPVSLMAFVIANRHITHIYSLLDPQRIAQHVIRLDGNL